MKIIAANWKLHKTPQEAREFCDQLLTQIPKLKAKNQLMIFPSALCLEAVAEKLKVTSVQFGLQNVHFEGQGAFTGENSATASLSVGAQVALVGHSERRALFHEKDEVLAKKVKFLQEQGLTPVFCIGETLAERESQRTIEVLEYQLREGLKLAFPQKSLVVAYEPVWAIGTGKVASLEQVEEAHQEVNRILKELGFNSATPILYGGSVKPDNASLLASIPHVHGFLIGGASLHVESYLAIASV
ncbi:MAG: triose-phosphate isomerase [Proteobacteria bacterium]|jgi:triosephosphate isomerase|nr:triose-phosphate isomerase [Pseudomonadota bacterium]